MSGKEFVDRINLLFPKGMKKSDFCHFCGISPNALSLWSARNTIPSADTAVKIAKFLNTSVEYLVTGIAPDNIPKEILDTAYEIYALPEVYKTLLFEMLKTLKADVSERAQERQQDIG